MTKKLHVPLHDSGDPVDLTGNTSPTNNGATDSVYGLGGLTAYSFDGSGNYVDVGTVGDLGSRVDDNLTFSVWARQNTDGGVIFGVNDSNGTIFRLRNDFTASNRLSYGFRDSSLNLLREYVDESIMGDNQWHHIAVSKSGNDVSQIEFYIDGVSKSTVTDSNGTPSSTSDLVDPLTIGANRSDSGFGSFFDGVVLDFRIYDRALSPSEIQTLYKFGAGDYTRQSLHDGSDSGAVSRWTFDNTLSDEWGDNDNWNDSTSDGYEESVYGAGKAFDGVDDELRLSSFPSDIPTGGESRTLSLWWKLRDDTSAYENMINYGTDNPDRFWGFIFRPDVRIFDGSSVYPLGGGGEVGEWYHLVATYDDGEINGYLNGVNTVTATNTLSTDASNFVIGARTDGDLHSDQVVDDVRIYDRALSQAEVAQLYREKHGADMRSRTVIQ